MRLYVRRGRCPVCQKPADNDHYHTYMQVTWWIWDSQHKAYRVLIIASLAVLIVFAALILSPFITLIREAL